MKLTKKKISFFKTHSEQKAFSQEFAIGLSYQQRLQECLRLTKKAFFEYYKDGDQDIKKVIKIYRGLPGESANDFYRRIKEDNG